MRFSPIVGVLGHRQVGKTTIMESMVKHYLTFDDEDTLIAAQKSPRLFLDSLAGTNIGIDECQLCEKTAYDLRFPSFNKACFVGDGYQ
jgi:predicted AAA+ superfamily ATPase